MQHVLMLDWLTQSTSQQVSVADMFLLICHYVQCAVMQELSTSALYDHIAIQVYVRQVYVNVRLLYIRV